MVRYIIISFISGIVFGVMDGIINANPFARELLKVYQSIARTSINAVAGIIIDLLYGFIMGFLFLLLYNALPGNSGIVKGITFALITWFFRVVMSTASTWMMFKVPPAALFYTLITGLLEMAVLGIIYGAFLKPFKL